LALPGLAAAILKAGEKTVVVSSLTVIRYLTPSFKLSSSLAPMIFPFLGGDSVALEGMGEVVGVQSIVP
jgi:hypothetical protein